MSVAVETHSVDVYHCMYASNVTLADFKAIVLRPWTSSWPWRATLLET